MDTENKQHELAVLAPYALISSVLFSVLTAALLVAGLYDVNRSTDELPARTIYTLVMYGSFSFAMGIAASCSFHAYLKLRKLKREYSISNVSSAIKSLVVFLKALYFWLILILLATCISIFLPIN